MQAEVHKAHENHDVGHSRWSWMSNFSPSEYWLHDL